MSGHMHLVAQDVLESHFITIVIHVRLSLSSPLSSSTSTSPSPSSPFSSAMQNLRTSANKVSNDAYDVHTSLTVRAFSGKARVERLRW